MKRLPLEKLFFALVVFLIANTPSWASPPEDLQVEDAKEILNLIDDMWRGNSSASILHMEIKTANWQRSLSMHSYSLGKNYSLVRIDTPKKEKGTATLKVESQIWNYLPKVNRTIKVPSSMLLSSWMGSHFTNDDLVKESRMSEGYTYRVSFTGERQGQKIKEITLIPRPNAPVVWGKMIIEVCQKDYLPISQRYFDEKGVLVRQATFSDYQVLDGRPMFLQVIMAPADKTGEYTKVRLEKVKFDVPLTADFFSVRNLQGH